MTTPTPPTPTWKETQRALATRARMCRVVKAGTTQWTSGNGSTYERLPNGQVVNLDKRARRAAQEDSAK